MSIVQPSAAVAAARVALTRVNGEFPAGVCSPALPNLLFTLEAMQEGAGHEQHEGRTADEIRAMLSGELTISSLPNAGISANST